MTNNVWINEIQYDNSSTDTGEGVEIAGPAGTDLTGWTVELYCGTGSCTYGTIALSGTIDDEENGYGALWFAADLTNGAPDGLCLVDAGSGAVQLLSYEGSFDATAGPCAGLTSTDIGVSEDGSTLAGESLQLGGTGNKYADFAWQAPQASTNDSKNTGQTFTP